MMTARKFRIWNHFFSLIKYILGYGTSEDQVRFCKTSLTWVLCLNNIFLLGLSLNKICHHVLFLNRKEQEEAERNKSIREAQLMLEKMEIEKKKREEEEKKRLAEIEVILSNAIISYVYKSFFFFKIMWSLSSTTPIIAPCLKGVCCEFIYVLGNKGGGLIW